MTTLNTTPRADGFRMPAEWETHSQTWMVWPERPDNWRNGGKPAPTDRRNSRSPMRWTPPSYGVIAPD